ncbi:MAG: MFS transporter [Cellulomonas sp.]|uniref:MFS transporter n=1 Tax=Cellulomonas sp. TaxID=40001 RepID=UPI0019F7DD23|nr:MFS transporter [Cellulomonas sp.]MBF0688161.1 MFS transporter [Cellulomonas sp.]
MYRYTGSSDRDGSTAPSRATAPQPGDGRPIVRDAATVVSYAVLGCYTFWLYAFGPAVTLLREELRFSYTTLSLYSVVWAGGAALAGAGFVRVARRLSRGSLLWLSTLASVGGATLFTLGRSAPATLTAAALFGFAGTMLLTVVQAILSDRHGSRRDQALTEANIAAGASAVLAPLVLGALALTVVGWRATFALPALVLLLLYLRHRRLPLPSPAPDPAIGRGGRLPVACWLFAVLTAVGSAIEFCLVYFGPQMLIDAGLSAAAASTALSSNYLGILLGRLLGAGLTRRAGRAVPLLYASLALTGVSFLVFWLTDLPVLGVVGLFACGVGIANLYPLSLALTLDAARGREDQANARSQVVVGLVAAAAPFLLGSLADRHGLGAAFALEPVLIGAAALLLWSGIRARRTAVCSSRIP